MLSLRARLNLAFVLPTAVIVIVLVAVAYVTARQGLEEELGKRLEAVGQVMAADMSEGIDAVQIERLDESMVRVRGRLEERLEKTRDATETSRIFIFDSEARSLVDTGEANFGETLYRIQADRREIERAFNEAVTTSGPLFRADDGIFHKTAYAPITNEGEVVAAVGVMASATYFELLTRFATILILLGTAGVVVVIAIGSWFARLLSRPVNVLVEAAGRLEEGDLETPVVGEGQSRWASTEELDYLMTAFEQMRVGLVERDQQMKMMLAGIAHEVRNPLGGMELFCGLLKDDLKSDGDGDDKIKKVERIEREVNYLEELVRDFLDFARPEGGDPRRVDAADFFAEVEEIVEADLENSRCELELNIMSGVELTVDPGGFRRAMINVVRNACQAQTGRQDGTITIGCKPDGDWRIVEVEDRGPGIEEEVIEQLFKPFFTTREKGSGLGLALTKRIIDEHGGQIEIDSEVGRGTIIRFLLPFDKEVTEAAEQDVEDKAIPDGWLG